MKSILYFALLIFMTTQVSAQHTIDIVAHRGNSSVAPENTLAAVKSAINLDPQPEWIEIDLHQSKDDVLVVIHDDTTQRTTGAPGIIRELTYNQLSKFHAGYTEKFGDQFKGERLPRLGDVLEAVEDTNINIMIECKQLLLEEPVINLLKERNELDRHIIASFDELTVYRAKELAPDVTTLYLVSEINHTSIGRAHDVEANIIGVNQGTPLESIKQAQDEGFKVWVWTVDDPKKIQDFAKAGADAIITNKPELALQLTRGTN